MSVLFKVTIDKTTGGYTTVYLWVYERLWWIFTVENIIKSERVPIGKAQEFRSGVIEMDERVKELPDWAQKLIVLQENDIVNLKKALGKIYSHSDGIVKVFAKLNVGAKNR
jgi:hypothetical protein